MPNENSTNQVIARWSFSGLSLYEKCPLAAKKKYVDKITVETTSEALLRGSHIHKQAELFIKGEVQAEELPTELRAAHLFPLLEQLNAEFSAGETFVEENWGFDMDWKPCDFDSELVWTRGSLDVFTFTSPTTAVGRDWKTGRRYPPKHIQQEQLYAVYAYRQYPFLTSFDFHFHYVDEKGKKLADITTTRTYKPEHIDRLQTGFHARGMRMTTDTTFKPHPNVMNCRWCDYKETCEWAVK